MTVLKTTARPDPTQDSARVRLIESAEALIAGHGILGVSVREIAAASGSANNGAVAYYFGTKAALVESIYRHRLPAIEMRRAELLRDLDRDHECCDAAALLRVLFQPLAEQTNAQGQHSYAGFLARVSQEGWARTWMDIGTDFPTTSAIARRLERLMPPSATASFAVRIRIVSSMVTQAIRFIDDAGQPGEHGLATRLFDDVLTMAAAAIVAVA